MSDYLNHVAARQLNLTSQIQPRLPALFEPVAPAAEMIGVEGSLDWNESSEAAEVAAVVRPPHFAPPITATSPSFSPPPALIQPAEPEPAAALKLPPISEPVPARVAAPPVEVASRLPVEPFSLLTTEPTPAQPMLPPRSEPNPPILPSPVQPEPPLPVQIVEKLTIPAVRPARIDMVLEQSLPPQPSTRPPVEPPDLREAPHPIPLLAETPPTQLPAKMVRPSATMVRPSIPVPPAEAPPVPTIQVTIGRIEIRATPASPPKKEARATSPVMSLDEYLRRRSPGGSR